MRLGGSLLVFGIAFLSLASASAQINIFNIANGDVAALKNALNSSNSDNRDDIINLATNGTYTLTAADNTTNGPTGLPVITADSGHTVTIHAHGSVLTRSGINVFRLLQTASDGNLSIDNLTVNNGQISGGSPGGGTFNNQGAGVLNLGTLTLTSCILSTNVVVAPSATAAGGTGDSGYGGAISSNGTLSLNGCTLDHNNVTGGHGGPGDMNNSPGNGGFGHGGAISAYGSTQITGCSFTDNVVHGGVGTSDGGALGGAIHFEFVTNATVTQCTFTNNTALTPGDSFGNGVGGAIHDQAFSQGPVPHVIDSTFANNSADHGGAIAGDPIVSGSTFETNTATSEGGASTADVFLIQNTAFFTNCTFHGNTAAFGGAVYGINPSNQTFMTLTNCTLVGNTASGACGFGGCVDGAGAEHAIVVNSIFKGNSSTNVLNVTSLGHNISDDAAGGDAGTGPGGQLNATGDMRNTNPQLLTSTPQNNGGLTPTFALIFNSPAINHGDDSLAPPRDQREYIRSGVSDIGAFENNGMLTPLGAVSRKDHGGTSFDVNLPLNGAPAGVECRRNTSTDVSGPNAGHDHQIIVTFPYPVSLDDATADHSVTVDPLPAGANTVYTINLHNVPNAQLITISMNHVSDGTNAFTDTIPMGILSGDTGGDGSVNSADIGQTKSKSGQTVDGTNFREDVTIDGSINSADISLVKSRSGTALSQASIIPESKLDPATD